MGVWPVERIPLTRRRAARVWRLMAALDRTLEEERQKRQRLEMERLRHARR